MNESKDQEREKDTTFCVAFGFFWIYFWIFIHSFIDGGSGHLIAFRVRGINSSPLADSRLSACANQQVM